MRKVELIKNGLMDKITLSQSAAPAQKLDHAGPVNLTNGKGEKKVSVSATTSRLTGKDRLSLFKKVEDDCRKEDEEKEGNRRRKRGRSEEKEEKLTGESSKHRKLTHCQAVMEGLNRLSHVGSLGIVNRMHQTPSIIQKSKLPPEKDPSKLKIPPD